MPKRCTECEYWKWIQDSNRHFCEKEKRELDKNLVSERHPRWCPLNLWKIVTGT